MMLSRRGGSQCGVNNHPLPKINHFIPNLQHPNHPFLPPTMQIEIFCTINE